MAKVTLTNVWKKFGDVEVVKDANLEIPDKQFLVLVGPSGCGKSTTLRMIAGLEEITEGTIEIGDQVVNDVAPKDRDIAMVFQNYALYPHMDVYNNMAFGLKLRKKSKSEIDERVRYAARILGIEPLLKRKPRQLSGGERQRVALGRAIVRQPKVFLMDEPLSNLDAKLRVQMRAELSKLHKKLETTIVYVTHDQTEAMTMGDKIVVMKGGYIQQAADPMTLYNEPNNMFVAGFIGSPAMNFLNVTLNRTDSTYFVEGHSFTLELLPEFVKQRPNLPNYVGKEVVLGIRPEDLEDAQLEDLDFTVTEANTIKAKVEVVELMGSEIFLYLNVGNQTTVARVDAESKARVGDDIKVGIDRSKIHLFDKNDEKTIN